jgi:hypothetical protein
MCRCGVGFIVFNTVTAWENYSSDFGLPKHNAPKITVTHARRYSPVVPIDITVTYYVCTRNPGTQGGDY